MSTTEEYRKNVCLKFGEFFLERGMSLECMAQMIGYWKDEDYSVAESALHAQPHKSEQIQQVLDALRSSGALAYTSADLYREVMATLEQMDAFRGNHSSRVAVRAVVCLLREGITNLESLSQMRRYEVGQIRNMGHNSMLFIEEVLIASGRSFKPY